MMAWTDTHCRFLHRQYSPNLLLFTEMVTTGALIHGQQQHLLDFNTCEHPIALQLGGKDPGALAECAAMAEERGYDEVNINVGCPSDRVQKGTFGACLMQQPELVATCVERMQQQCNIPVTVKCRTGVALQHAQEATANLAFLETFVDHIVNAGCERLYLHARIAILGGLSPAQNRDIPPLTVEKGQAVKQRYPHLQVIMNGGITSVTECQELLSWCDGVMIGRAAYHRPTFLSELERAFFDAKFTISEEAIVDTYARYARQHVATGTRLNALTKHMLHCFNGRPGARRFRQLLSNAHRLRANDVDVIDEALSHIHLQGEMQRARQSAELI